MPGQLDEISQAIGELKAYVHEYRHGVNNIGQKIDALGTKITRDIAAVEARIETKLDSHIRTTEARLTALEQARARQMGERGVMMAILKSPVVGWLVAFGGALWLLLNGKQP